MMNSCHYSTLGVERGASIETITAAYRRLAMKWHPDRHLQQEHKITAEAKFKQIQNAYAVLSNPASRNRYDGASRPGSGQQASQKPESQPGKASPPKWDEHAPRGQNIKHKQSIKLRDALNGCEIKVDFRRERKCQACRGKGVKAGRCAPCGGNGTISERRVGKIQLPPGLIHGSLVRVRNAGWPSQHGGAPGDLEIAIAIAAERDWKVKGADLHGPVQVGFATALLGGAVHVALPTGKVVSVMVPERSSTGKKIRLTGGGLTQRSTGNTGDVILTVSIAIPKARRKLSAAQEALLREIEAADA